MLLSCFFHSMFKTFRRIPWGWAGVGGGLTWVLLATVRYLQHFNLYIIQHAAVGVLHSQLRWREICSNDSSVQAYSCHVLAFPACMRPSASSASSCRLRPPASLHFRSDAQMPRTRCHVASLTTWPRIFAFWAFVFAYVVLIHCFVRTAMLQGGTRADE